MAVRPVTAFSLEGLPRLPRRAPALTRVLARGRAGLPAELAVTLKGLGLVTVSCGWLDFAGAESAGPSFALEVRGHRGRLVVEPALALRLVSAVLGQPPPLTIRPLGRAERGVLAAVIATFLQTASLDSVRVGLEDTGPAARPDTLVVQLRVRTGRGSGLAILELSAPLVAALPVGPMRADARDLAPQVTVELARTTLPATAFATAEAGDRLVFEGTSPAPSDGPWPVRIHFGASCAGELFPDGSLRRRGPIGPAESESRRAMSADDANITAPVPKLPLSDEAARVLAAAPVEIVAEVGRLTVRGDELVGLVEGGVLALGPRRPAEVVLRVGGRPWAHGELVAVDDELAVRITALVK
jgi:type III secretion system YscQ/HrcQ family protein